MKGYVLSNILVPEVYARVCGRPGLRLQVGLERGEKGGSVYLSASWSFERKPLSTFTDVGRNLQRGKLLEIMGPEDKLDEYLRRFREIGEALQFSEDQYFVSMERVAA